VVIIKQIKKTNMTPKEKAKELFDKYADEFNFDDTYRGYREQSKQCALITCNEVLNSYNEEKSNGYIISDKIIPYWQEVKQEIQKL